MANPIIAKRCSKRKQIKPLSEFHKDKKTKDGLKSACKICKLNWMKVYAQSEKDKEKIRIYQERYRKIEKNRQAHNFNSKQYRQKNRLQIQARSAVNNAIRAGKLKYPNTLQCSCSMKAQNYHHHKGYAKEHWLNVVPICIPCHHKLHR